MSLSNLNTFNYSLSLDGLQTIEADSIILNGDEIDFSKYYTKDETYSKEELKYVIEVDDLNDELKNYYTKTDSDAKYPLKTDLTSYLLVNTFNIERQTLIDAIALKLDASIISNYSTTTQLNNAISDALLNYFTKTEINNFGFQNSGQVSTAITNALSNYYTQSQINNFNYQSENQVSTSISNALVNYYTQSQINNFGYQNSSQVNTAINNAISHLSTVDGTNQTIIDALVNYPTNQSLQDTLSNYVLSTFLSSNYSTSSNIASTYKTISSFNSDINNYYTKSQSDSNYISSNTAIIPFTTTNSPLYTFKIENLGFQNGGQTFRLGVYDAAASDGIQTRLIMGGGYITTPGNFQGVSPTQFSYLTNISSDVQNQLNARALITDLNNYVLSSTLNNYSTTTQLNNILTSYATIAMISDTNSNLSSYLKLDGTSNMTGSINSSSDFPLYFSKNVVNVSNKFVTQIDDTNLIHYAANPGNTVGTWYHVISGNNVAMVTQQSFYTAESNVSPNAFECMRITPGIVRILNEMIIGGEDKNIRFHKTNVAQNADFKNNKMFFRHVDSNDVASNILELTPSAVIAHKEIQGLNIRGEDIYGLTFNIFPHPTQQNAVLYVDSTGVITQSTITSTVLEYLSGTTSNIQTQITNNTNNFNNYYNKTYIDENVVIKDVLNNVNINSLRINANTTDSEGYQTVLSMTCNSSGSNLVCYAERKNSEPIEKELTLNNVNIVTLDGESKLKIHVESLSSNSICSFLLKDSNNVLQPKLRLGFGANNNKLYGTTDYDDLKGDILSANTLTINNLHNISSPHFISQIFNRPGNVNFGVGTEYRISDVGYARIFGGNAGSNNGYITLNIANNGGFVSNYWDAQFYLTNTGMYTRGTSTVLGLNNNKYFEFGTEASNTAYLDFHSNESKVSDYESRIASQIINNINTLSLFSTDINLTGKVKITSNSQIDGELNCSNFFSIQMNYPTQYYYSNLNIAHSWAVQTGDNQYLFYKTDSNGVFSVKATIGSDGTYTPSDRSLKNDIQPINKLNSLQKILNSEVVHYLLKDNSDDKRSIGVIANDIEKINPYCVKQLNKHIKTEDNKEEEKILTVNYNDLFLHNISATQEIYKLIKNQEDEINKLKNIIVEMNETLINIINYINK
jgi:hypothetical protein